MTAPFVRVELRELRQLAALPKREAWVLLALRALTYDGRTTRRRDVESLTGYSLRHVGLACGELERIGRLRCVYCGDRRDPWGRFRVAWSSDPQDQTSSDPGDQRALIPKIGAHLSGVDPGIDLQQSPPSKTERVPARGAGRDGGDPLEELAARLWPALAVRVARGYLRALRELAPDATDAELARYLRRCASDPTLERATIPLAVAVTADRVHAWRRQQRPAARTRPAGPARNPADVFLAPDELAELADKALRSL